MTADVGDPTKQPLCLHPSSFLFTLFWGEMALRGVPLMMRRHATSDTHLQAHRCTYCTLLSQRYTFINHEALKRKKRTAAPRDTHVRNVWMFTSGAQHSNKYCVSLCRNQKLVIIPNVQTGASLQHISRFRSAQQKEMMQGKKRLKQPGKSCLDKIKKCLTFICERKPIAADNIFILQSWPQWTKGLRQVSTILLAPVRFIKISGREGGGAAEAVYSIVYTQRQEHGRCGICS